MAKIDATRNYYADLAIGPTASDNDIRKSFRKLALECHPDRHPGQEQEWVAKFQQIQAAHEILSDPQQRAKYDQERRKYRNMNIPQYQAPPPTTPRARPPPPPRNAYTSTPNGGQYYRGHPPKPQAQPQAQWARPQPPKHGNTYAPGAFPQGARKAPTAQKADPRTQPDRANVFTAWQEMKHSSKAQAKPQPANNPNNPNGAPFGRSQSTRVPSNRKGFDPASAGADEGQARSAYRSNYERPKAPYFDDDDDAEDVPFSEANRVRTPYSSSKSGERMSMFADGVGVGRSTSVRNSPSAAFRPSSAADPGTQSDSAHSKQRASYGGGASKKNPFPHMYVSSDEDTDTPGVSRAPRPPKRTPKQPPRQSGTSQNIFGVSPHLNNASPSPFKSKSAESINMTFSPSGWDGVFQGSSDYFNPNLTKGGATKGRVSPSRGRPAQRQAAKDKTATGHAQAPPPPPSFGRPQSANAPPPIFPHPINTQTEFTSGSSSAPHTAKFEPQDWAETFKEPSWAYPIPSQSKETSPRRGSAAPKRPNPARKGSVAPEGSSNKEEHPERKSKYQAFAEELSVEDAMDVDDEEYELKEEKSKPAPAPPGRPKAKATGVGAVPKATTSAASASTNNPPAPGLNGLAGLATVEPFLPPTNQGLGLDALKDSLPFKSGASQSHPTKPNTAQKLSHPKVPAAPQVPDKLDKANTADYLSRMDAYVKQYRIWNANMLSHLVGRNEELNTHLDDHFVQQRGETTKNIGFPGYITRMKEDEQVMETWKLGQEIHTDAMLKCQDVRNKTLKQWLGPS